MKRKEVIRIHLNKILNNCNDEDLYNLFLMMQDTDVLYGYATALLMGFEDKKIGPRKDYEVSEMIKSGKYYRLFNEWLEENV